MLRLLIRFPCVAQFTINHRRPRSGDSRLRPLQSALRRQDPLSHTAQLGDQLSALILPDETAVLAFLRSVLETKWLHSFGNLSMM